MLSLSLSLPCVPGVQWTGREGKHAISQFSLHAVDFALLASHFILSPTQDTLFTIQK